MDEWCRLCGVENLDDMIQLDAPLLDQISNIFGIQIKPADEHSHVICRQCNAVVKEIAELIMDYQAKQKYLMEKFKKVKNSGSQQRQSTLPVKKPNFFYNCIFCKETFSRSSDLRKHAQKNHRKLIEACNKIVNPCHVTLQKLPFEIPKKKSNISISSNWMHIDENNVRKIDFKIPHCFLSKHNLSKLSSKSVNDETTLCKKTKRSENASPKESDNASVNIQTEQKIAPANNEGTESFCKISTENHNSTSVNCITSTTYESEVNLINEGPEYLCGSATMNLNPASVNCSTATSHEAQKKNPSSTQELPVNQFNDENNSIADESQITIYKKDILSIVNSFFKQKLGFGASENPTTNFFLKAISLGHVDVNWTPLPNHNAKKGVFFHSTDKVTVINEIDTMEGFQYLKNQHDPNDPNSNTSKVNSQVPKQCSTLVNNMNSNSTGLIPKIVSTFTVPVTKINNAPAPAVVNNEPTIGLIVDKNKKASVGLIKCKPTKLLMSNKQQNIHSIERPQTIPCTENNFIQTHNVHLPMNSLPTILPQMSYNPLYITNIGNPIANIPLSVSLMNFAVPVNSNSNIPPLQIANVESQNHQNLAMNGNCCDRLNEVFRWLQEDLIQNNVILQYIDYPSIREPLIQVTKFAIKEDENPDIPMTHVVYLFIDSRETLVLSITDRFDIRQNFSLWTNKRQRYVFNSIKKMHNSFTSWMDATPHLKPLLQKFLRILWNFRSCPQF